ncbi:potassium channel family protein [Gracilimonas halophila]|uniref:Potassium channel family protein n=1 Tax=Gracilimonas halophila TaxID=1834464 RepID=A0ABW5JIT8_9BACT
MNSKFSWQNKILIFLVGVIAIILIYAKIFMWGMGYFEGQQVTLAQSIQVVVESLTTSGYGGFAPWESDFMNYFILWMNFTGLALLFIAFPVFFIPSLKNVMSRDIPRKINKQDHVIICDYSSYTEALIEELNSRNKDYVIIEDEEEKAKGLMETGFNVMLGDPEQKEILEAACIDKATAVVIHTDIYKNISTIFTVKNIETNAKVIAILRDENMKVYYDLAGADITIAPRQLVGKTLAEQIPAVSINDSVEIDNNLEIVEIDIQDGSELCDQVIGKTDLLKQYNINIIGAWVKGEFQSPVHIDLELSSNTRLLVAGFSEELENLTKKAVAKTRDFTRNEVLILGYGQSGQAVAEVLRNTSVSVKVVDIEDKEGVDIIGDVREPKVLSELGVEDASAIIITIRDDTAALFATLMSRNKNRQANIIVRANDKGDVQKLYQAGADYVQSLATVSGRMLASCIFEDETSIAANKQINLIQLPVGSLAGKTLAGADVRAQTGCTILVVIRGDERFPKVDPNDFVFRDGDEVILAGTDESTQEFERRYLN